MSKPGWAGICVARRGVFACLVDGDPGCGDGGGDLDILGPIDGKDVRPGGFFAVDPYKVDSAAAGTEGLHEGWIVDGGGLRSVEEVEFAADDVAGFLGAAPFGVVAGKDADANIDIGVEQKGGELAVGDADGVGSGKACDDLWVVAYDSPSWQADDHAVGHHAGFGGDVFDEGIDFSDGIAGVVGSAPSAGAVYGGEVCGNGVEYFGLMGGDGRGNKRPRFGLLQVERIALPCLVALVVIDGDFQSLGEAVVSGIGGGELKPAGGTADGAGGIEDLEGVFVVEGFVLSGGCGDYDFRRDEERKAGFEVLRDAACVVGEGDVEGGCAHDFRCYRLVGFEIALGEFNGPAGCEFDHFTGNTGFEGGAENPICSRVVGVLFDLGTSTDD